MTPRAPARGSRPRESRNLLLPPTRAPGPAGRSVEPGGDREPNGTGRAHPQESTDFILRFCFSVCSINLGKRARPGLESGARPGCQRHCSRSSPGAAGAARSPSRGKPGSVRGAGWKRAEIQPVRRPKLGSCRPFSPSSFSLSVYPFCFPFPFSLSLSIFPFHSPFRISLSLFAFNFPFPFPSFLFPLSLSPPQLPRALQHSAVCCPTRVSVTAPPCQGNPPPPGSPAARERETVPAVGAGERWRCWGHAWGNTDLGGHACSG